MAIAITQRMREIAAEHLRRDNKRAFKQGRTLNKDTVCWDDKSIGAVLTGKRDSSPVVQIVADTFDMLGIID